MKPASDRKTRRGSLGTRVASTVAEIARDDPRLSEELQNVREKARTRPETLEMAAPLADLAPEMPDVQDFALETIVLRTARPVLAIKSDEAVLAFSPEDSETWKERLELAAPQIGRAIRAVGRVEVQAHPIFEWIGTGWLVAPDVVVTNRHVASEFGRRAGQHFGFRQGVGGRRMQGSIDFVEEFDRTESAEFSFERILHIEDEDGPDVAFVQVRPVEGRDLAPHIVLSATAPEVSEYVAVIGYPARDGRVPDQDLMRTIFGDQYNKKRLAPGQIKPPQPSSVLHDCSTLGGNSGSVVLSLSSGEAVGLHFSGRFLEANYAVPAHVIAERLERISRGESSRRPPPRRDVAAQRAVASPAVPIRRSAGVSGHTVTIPIHVSVEVGTPVAGGGARVTSGVRPLPPPDDSTDDLVETEARAEDYSERPGYARDFLGQGTTVPLPGVTAAAADVRSFEVNGRTHQILKYQHFSVIMSRSRRLCRYSAVNIDGKKSRKAKRRGWRNDPRIPADAQIAKECYGNAPKFARGHMSRREDPIWGSDETAELGNADSMHVTNAVPQMQPFNAGIWLGLEDYALDHAREDDMRISVFTGPFLEDDDPMRYGVQIPVSFWKVIAFIHDETGDLCATGYQMTQEDYLREEEFIFGKHKTAQVSIAGIEHRAGLSFGRLAELDPFDQVEEALPSELQDFSQIRFYR